MRAWENAVGDILSLHVFLKVPDLAGPLSGIDRIRDGYRTAVVQVGGGLVEVEADELGGLPALRTIFRFPQDPHGVSYIGAWTIPRRSFSFVIKVCCAEHGTTGIREAASWIASSDSRRLRMTRSKVGFQDPHDPGFRAPVLRNSSDDAEWDEVFPQHPLSRARACLRSVKESISIGEDVRRSEPFVGPQAKDCPGCGLVNPPGAQRCDCGYDFGKGRMERSYLQPAVGIGGVFLALAIIRLVLWLSNELSK